MRPSTSGAMSLRRAARRSAGDNPLIARSSMNTASIFCTASNAIGEITADVLPRAFEAMSASSKNLRLACALSRALDKAHYLESQAAAAVLADDIGTTDAG